MASLKKSFELTAIDYLNEEQSLAVNDITKQFELSTSKVREIMNHFTGEMEKGLKEYGQTVAMIPSFVTGIPTGDETGTFLALDLGGTNLRVCQVEFQGGHNFDIKQAKYKIDEPLKTGSAQALFDYIAGCVAEFLGDQSARGRLEMGFTFSFPVEQTAIDKGTLLRWTKGFEAKGAVREDVVRMLQVALDNKNVPVNVTAIVNDTVGTLLAHAYQNKKTLLGIILGTGTNCAYFEETPNIKKLGETRTESEHMVVNIEWGNFDTEHKILPITMFDNKLDRESINPHEQTFEKLTSGMYLGEIARNVILHLIDRDLLFNGIQVNHSTFKEINKPWSLETEWMGNIDADDSPNLDKTKLILENNFNIFSSSLTDRQIVKRVCQLVGIRSARLVASTLAGVVSRRGAIKIGCNVGIDGSLFEFYPSFGTHIASTLTELFGSDADGIKAKLARDGSGVGAALAALMAAKHRS